MADANHMPSQPLNRTSVHVHPPPGAECCWSNQLLSRNQGTQESPVTVLELVTLRATAEPCGPGKACGAQQHHPPGGPRCPPSSHQPLPVGAGGRQFELRGGL